MNNWRFSDKPNEISLDELKIIDLKESKEWIATMKLDGYRAIIDFEKEDPRFFSRRDKSKGGPVLLDVSSEILDLAKKFQVDNSIPVGSRLDAEWSARREGARSVKSSTMNNELITVFGVCYWGSEWMGLKTEDVRWDFINKLSYNSKICIVEGTDCNYVDLYNKSKIDYKYEGIVLKHKNSKLIGDISMCKNNPLWLKCKWRSGDDGQTEIV